MNVVVTGGAGFIGRKLIERLLSVGGLTDRDGKPARVERIVAFDVAEPQPPFSEQARNDPRLEVRLGEVSDRAAVEALITPDTDAVFHLAAVVSAGAEQDFDLGMRVNLYGTLAVLDACRRLETAPRLVFASSVAVFGGDMPKVIEDRTWPTPRTSYGTQKEIGELLVSDMTRKGFVEGRSLRLPTIVVRPGKPNKAASTWASSILREPLQGQEAVCPVPAETKMWVLSPRRVVDAFIHACNLPADAWGQTPVVSLPGMTLTVTEMVEALRRVAGDKVVSRIRWEIDPFIKRIVDGWPTTFEPSRGRDLGFRPDDSMDEIVQAFVDDELGGRVA